MKKLLVTAFATTALLLAGCSDKGTEVASTEAGRIREQDLYEQMKNEPLQNGLTIGETVLQKMILESIFDQLYGKEVTDADIDAELEKSAEPYGTMDEYRELLEMQGIDIDYVRDSVRLQLLMREALLDDIEITDEMIEEEYEASKPDYTAQHILVEDEETANDIIAQLNDGADFGELVTEYSQDPGSLETEGTYTFSKGQMVPEFEGAVDGLEAGELTSEPVQSGHGFHVIRRLELDLSEMPTVEDDREAIEETIVNGYLEDQNYMGDLITRLADKVNVQIADDELKGAMAAYLPQEAPTEEDVDAEETETDADADADATEEDAE